MVDCSGGFPYNVSINLKGGKYCEIQREADEAEKVGRVYPGGSGGKGRCVKAGGGPVGGGSVTKLRIPSRTRIITALLNKRLNNKTV